MEINAKLYKNKEILFEGKGFKGLKKIDLMLK
jgi:hypothetical protein